MLVLRLDMLMTDLSLQRGGIVDISETKEALLARVRRVRTAA